MKKHLRILCFLIAALSFTACGVFFNGSRLGNDHEFVMDYEMFNTTDSQSLTAQEGDTIHAKIVVLGGSLSFTIQKDNEVPVYEGKDVIFSDEFDVAIEKSGTYTVTVTGKKARGSVSFTVEARQ